MMREKDISKRLTKQVIVIAILAICLCVTTLALVYESLTIEESVFTGGKVSLDINGGEPVITAGEFLFAPGAAVEKPFYLKNNSTCDVYYRLYFGDVEGGLADHVIITIKKGALVLYHGKITALTARGAAANDVLEVGETRDLTISFEIPAETDSSVMGESLSFTLKADAVQVKNNDHKEFE